MMQISARDLASILNVTLEGNPDTVVTGVAKIEEASADALCFIANPKYESYAQTATAGIVIMREGLAYNERNIKAVLRSKDPYATFQQLMELYQKLVGSQSGEGIEQWTVIGSGTHYGEGFYLGAFSYLGKNISIGKNVKIYPHCYIGDNSIIGDDVTIYAGVRFYPRTQVGSRCIIHSGVVIGGDGFGFAPQPDGSYKKIPHTGNVVIGNDVELGANTCIDRATIGSTIIKDGVKLDNLIMIGHNVEIGENTVMAGQSGVAGSAKLGRNMMVGGQVGINGHITVADGTKVNAQSAISKPIKTANTSVTGSPAMEFMKHYRLQAGLKEIPDLLKRLEALERQLNIK